jgi:hypothetical protein
MAGAILYDAGAGIGTVGKRAEIIQHNVGAAGRPLESDAAAAVRDARAS